MHIVQVYHSKVPVRLYGGMERVIESLCAGFVEMGHKVSLIAYRGDYQLPGVNFIELDNYISKSEAVAKFQELIPNDADIIHYHVPHNWPTVGIPNLTTMHGNLSDDEDLSTLPKNTVFVSHKHALNHGRDFYIYHGLVPNEIPCGSSKLSERDGLAFLGRASLKRKGLHLAKMVAKTFNTKLYVGGGRGFSFGNTKYLGHLNNQQKYDLLGRSRAFLFPVLWEEPFGLVMIEAMFCGTPVWALNHGSVPEILGQEDVNFFLRADNIEQLIERARHFDFSVDPQEIRSYACKHFSYLKMCNSYLDYYKTL